jgi:hypothetical protein
MPASGSEMQQRYKFLIFLVFCVRGNAEIASLKGPPVHSPYRSSSLPPRYGTERDAERAVSMMNGQRVDNKNIIVSLF